MGSNDRRRARGAGGALVGAVLVLTGLLAGCTSSGDAAVASGSADIRSAETAASAVSASATSSVVGSTTSGGGSAAGTGSADGTATAAGTMSAEVTPSGGGTAAGTAPRLTETVVPLAPGTADEASGIAAATTMPGAYFLVDDGTGTDRIVAVGSDGAVVARIEIDGMSAGNAEALASGTCGATPGPGPTAETCLYVGDIGDNAADRDDITIYRVAEPDLSVPPTDPVPSDEWRYTYPDKPQNAEAMLVDPAGALLIVTKPRNNEPHRIYRAEPGGGELVLVREFRPPAPQVPMRTLFTGNVVTDAASAPGRVLVLTYDEVQEYVAPSPDADIADFPDWSHTGLPLPALPQAEGITANADGCGYTVASEAGPAGKAGALGIMRCN